MSPRLKASLKAIYSILFKKQRLLCAECGWEKECLNGLTEAVHGAQHIQLRHPDMAYELINVYDKDDDNWKAAIVPSYDMPKLMEDDGRIKVGK